MAALGARATRTVLQLVFLLAFLGTVTEGCSGAGQTVTQGPLELSVEVGLGGVIRPGLPFPVQVRLENRGPDTGGELRALTRRSRLDQPWSQVDELRLPVRIPAGARLSFNFTLVAADLVHPLVVELWPQTRPGAEPLRLEVELRGLAARGRVLAVVSRRGLNLPLEEAPDFRNVQVIQLPRPEALPHRWDGWLAADWVVIDDIPLSSLAGPQTEALRLWTQAGGRLLILPRAASGLPADSESMLPVTPLGRSLSLQETTTDLGPIPEGSTLYLSLAQPGSETLHSLAGVPLAARAPLGLGTRGWVGFDLADPMLPTSLGAALLQASLGGSPRVPPWDPASGSSTTWRALRSVPILPRSPLPLGTLLALHGLLAYLLVRWVWRHPRALLLGLAGLAAVSSVLIWLSRTEAPATAASGVQIVEVAAGWGRGWGAWVVGQAGAGGTRLGRRGESWQAGPLDDGREEPRTLLTLEGSLESYLWEGPGYLPATVRWPLQFDLHLTPGGNGIWRLENRSDRRLEMVLFYDGENLLPLPDLAPGASLSIDPRDPFLRLGRIGVRPGGVTELRRWTVSRLDPDELTAPRTPLITRAMDEGWELLERQTEPLPVVLARVEPSPVPAGAPPSGPAPVVTVVLLRPTSSPGGARR